jgi:hypothetical protein
MPEKKELKLSLVKVEKEILKEEKLIREINKSFERILVQLDSLVDTSTRQLEELSTSNITKISNTSKAKFPLLELNNMLMSYNLSYLRLQQRMEQESRQFTMVSNIFKSKHDTAKSVVNNIQ